MGRDAFVIATRSLYLNENAKHHSCGESGVTKLRVASLVIVSLILVRNGETLSR